MNNYIVGKISAVKGISVRAWIIPNLHKVSYFFENKVYRGIGINELILIRRGFYDLVAKVEGEEIIERKEYLPQQSKEKQFDRFVDLKILGYFDDGLFRSGIKYLPMLDDEITLITDEQIEKIYDFSKSTNSQGSTSISIGNSLLENIKFSMPINGVFNSHLGIFGNTGSGKSNTLAKLYVELFNSKLHKSKAFRKNAQFVFLDFGGEYQNIHKNFPQYVRHINLNTHKDDGDEKISITESTLWDAEFLSVLFSATEKTQKPFLAHLVESRKKYGNDLRSYFETTLQRAFGENQHKETLNLLRQAIEYFPYNSPVKIQNLTSFKSKLDDLEWYSKDNIFWHKSSKKYINSYENIVSHFSAQLLSAIDLSDISPFSSVVISSIFQLINSTAANYTQYEFISPLISKMTASINALHKLIEVKEIADKDANQNKIILVVSLRDCNVEMKKTIPMVLIKHYFATHKSEFLKAPQKTMHFITDEAHNILSSQSSREASTWKDYRLELFEEVIKEGRKYGFFITIASQRPADISPTIISQLHNYFIHRLVNENDLLLIRNAISSLDGSSRSLIPTLPQGACVVSGVAFHTPIIVQIQQLPNTHKPNSDTINLDTIWKDDEIIENDILDQDIPF